jgi:hypothetical protein
MMAFAGRHATVDRSEKLLKPQLYHSICQLCLWLENNGYRGYDAFDGLNAKVLRPFTFHNKLLLTVLQQGVRRFPVNVRPLLGIGTSHSSKAMGFLARGFMRLHEATGNTEWQDKADFALNWLVGNQCEGYSGACWGNHFDYQSRAFYLPRGVPTVVWTSLIGHAFLDAHVQFQKNEFLQVAVSSCEHILRDLDTYAEDNSLCISYIPTENKQVHNANTLAASLLARTYSYTGRETFRLLAEKAIQYTANHQRPDSSWDYGEASNLRWVDNFHTAYVLDSLKHYGEATGDTRFETALTKGYEYWKSSFFLPDGTPKYYNHKTLPIDIQCCSQAIDTLVFFSDRDPESLLLARKVAKWTIDNMQDRNGYFYYRRYSPWLVNKTPMLHWGQATMLCALAGLYRSLLHHEV